MILGAASLVANVFDVAATIESGFCGFIVLGGGTIAAWRQQAGISGFGRCPGCIYFLEECVVQLVLSHGESCAK